MRKISKGLSDSILQAKANLFVLLLDTLPKDMDLEHPDSKTVLKAVDSINKAVGECCELHNVFQ